MRHSQVLTLSTQEPSLSLPPSPTSLLLLLLLPLSRWDSGQAWCWKTERWEMEGSALPFQRSRPWTCLGPGRGKKRPSARRCRFLIILMHVSVDMPDIFTWSRKRVIWWRVLLILRRPPLPSCLEPQAWLLKHLPWERAKKSVRETLFYLQARAILAFPSLYEWPICSDDWGRASLLESHVAGRPCGYQEDSPLWSSLCLLKLGRSPLTLMS